MCRGWGDRLFGGCRQYQSIVPKIASLLVIRKRHKIADVALNGIRVGLVLIKVVKSKTPLKPQVADDVWNCGHYYSEVFA